MKHYIIVKFKPGMDLSAHMADIAAIFDKTKNIPGVRDIALYPGINQDINANRYDLMIEMTMDSGSLPAYDASAPHREWKEKYGQMIEQKCIFDRV